jgi:hypothetical protein
MNNCEITEFKKNKHQSLRDPRDYNRSSFIHVIKVLEGQEKEDETLKVFKKLLRRWRLGGSQFEAIPGKSW